MGDNSNTTPALDGGWGWMIVLGFFGCNFFMVGIAKSFGIILEELVEYFDTDVAKAALVLGVAGGLYTFASPFGLAFGQHFSQRVVVIFGGIIGCIGVSLSYYMISIEYVICTFGIFAGLSNACLFGNGLVMLGYYFEKRRSIANALALTGASIGQFAIPPILQLLLDSYTLRGAFLILGGFYLNLCVFGCLYRPLSFYSKRKKTDQLEETDMLDQNNTQNTDDITLEDEHDKNDKEKLVISNSRVIEVSDVNLLKHNQRYGYLSSTGSLVMGSMESLGQIVVTENHTEIEEKGSKKSRVCGLTCPELIHWSVLKNPIVIIYTIISFFLFFGYFNFIIFMPIDATSRGIEKFEKTWLVSISGIGDLLGRIFIGILGDLNLFKRYKLMGIMCVISGINIVMYGIATTYWWMAIHVAVYGFSGGAYVAINAVVLIDLVGLEVMPRALGMILLIQGAGAALGQPFEGYIRDVTLSFQSLSYLNGFCMIFGSILLLVHPWIVKLFKSSKESPEETENSPKIVVTYAEEKLAENGGRPETVN